MPTKLGNGGKGPEAYNPQDGRYTDEGNISQEEAQAMRLMGLGETTLAEQQRKLLEKNANRLKEPNQRYDIYPEFKLPEFEIPGGYAPYDAPRENSFPWDWDEISIDDFDVTGFSRMHLDDLIYDYKKYMKTMENKINMVGNWFGQPTKEEIQEYEKIKAKFEKYLPKFNKNKYDLKMQ